MKRTLIFLLLLIFIFNTNAQPTDIEKLVFMAGHWTRTTNGMYVEQIFMPPVAGTVSGLQRRSRNDSTLVTFFFLIEETAKGIVCRFKHFENDFQTYEDRTNSGPRTFNMIETAPNSVIFEERTPEGSLYLRYRKTENDQLAIAVGSMEELKSNTATESFHTRKQL